MVIHMVELVGLVSTVSEQLKTNPVVDEPSEVTAPVPDPDWLNVDQVASNRLKSHPAKRPQFLIQRNFSRHFEVSNSRSGGYLSTNNHPPAANLKY